MSFREHPIFKTLTRPAVALLIAVALFGVLFPSWGPRDLTLDYRLPSSGCAEDITASAYSEGVLTHSLKIPIGERRSLESVLSLPRAEYRVAIELGCSDGRLFSVAERRVDVHEHTELSFDLSKQCPCLGR
jgi:hypothetical protein